MDAMICPECKAPVGVKEVRRRVNDEIRVCIGLDC